MEDYEKEEISAGVDVVDAALQMVEDLQYEPFLRVALGTLYALHEARRARRLARLAEALSKAASSKHEIEAIDKMQISDPDRIIDVIDAMYADTESEKVNAYAHLLLAFANGAVEPKERGRYLRCTKELLASELDEIRELKELANEGYRPKGSQLLSTRPLQRALLRYGFWDGNNAGQPSGFNEDFRKYANILDAKFEPYVSDD